MPQLARPHVAMGLKATALHYTTTYDKPSHVSPNPYFDTSPPAFADTWRTPLAGASVFLCRQAKHIGTTPKDPS
ncbi:hypothetical protein ACJQWK_05110 [Exserohilum turcicum]